MSGATRPAGYYDDIYGVERCSVCGADMEWVDCDGCEDGMYNDHDNDPINEPPGSWVTCEQCQGKGGWLGCPRADSAEHRLVPSAPSVQERT